MIALLAYAIGLVAITLLLRSNPAALIVTTMLITSQIGAHLISTPWGVTNAGNISYALAFFCCSFFSLRSTQAEFADMVRLVLLASGLSVGANMLLQPDIWQPTMLIIPAGSFAAFYLSSAVNHSIITGGEMTWHRKITANWLGQLVDSLIFFPFTFGVSQGERIGEMILSGFLFKCFLNTIDTPLFMYVIARAK